MIGSLPPWRQVRHGGPVLIGHGQIEAIVAADDYTKTFLRLGQQRSHRTV